MCIKHPTITSTPQERCRKSLQILFISRYIVILLTKIIIYNILEVKWLSFSYTFDIRIYEAKHLWTFLWFTTRCLVLQTVYGPWRVALDQVRYGCWNVHVSMNGDQWGPRESRPCLNINTVLPGTGRLPYLYNGNSYSDKTVYLD